MDNFTIGILVVAIIIIIGLFYFLTKKAKESLEACETNAKSEIQIREESIAAANKLVEQAQTNISTLTTDKATANRMLEETKVEVGKALQDKLAADKLVVEAKAVAAKALSDKTAADTAAANYKKLMDQAILDKVSAEKAMNEYKTLLADANAKKIVAEQAVVDLKAAMAAAAAKSAPLGIRHYTTPNVAYDKVNQGHFNLANPAFAVNCPAGGLNRLHLRTDDVNAQYEFTCAHGGNMGAVFTKETPFDASGEKGINIFLDRQGIDCGVGNAITGLQYIKDPNANMIKYNYKCAPVPGAKCRDVSTPPFADGWDNFRFLERHDVKCDPDEVISRMRVGRPSPSEISYNYTCCKA